MDLPRAICFDLDDTLIDFSSNVLTAWDDACVLATEANGLDAGVLAREVLRVRDWYWSDPGRHAAGRQDLRAASAEIVDLAMKALGASPEAGLPRRIADHYRDLREASIVLMPGAVELLEHLASRGVALALVTNGSQADQRAKIERFDLERRFDHIQVEGEFGLGKPYEAVYRHVSEQLGVPPDASWFVGDHLEWDVAAPQRLGFAGIWVDYGGTGLPPGHTARPHRTLRVVSELLDD
ncbi:MAG: HAD family hydrolase, partial [Dehalococcoidia bacterium]